MKQNEIFRSYGTDFTAMTKRLLETAGLADEIPSPVSRICLKPNLVTPTPASYGATTHPEVVAGVIEYLQEHGFSDITIAEGSWIGDKTTEAFEYCGYNALARKYGVRILDTKKERGVKTDTASMDLNLCACVADFDFLINIPVLKGHCQTRVTCALKNMKGLIPDSEKRRFHTMGLHKPIAYLNTCIHQDFIVIDHICGDPSFEEGGNPLVRNCVMAAKDPVLADAYACTVLGVDREDVPYIGLAQSAGVGSADLSRLHLVTIEGDDTSDTPCGHNLLSVSYAVDEVDSCSACYASLVPALQRLEEEGLLEMLSCPIAIGQGHRGKTGKIGVGECTSGFEYYVKGCPPDEEDIYSDLKHCIIEQE